MSYRGLSAEELQLFSKIDLFISCLYSLSNYSKGVSDYFSFSGNANTISNPNLTQDMRKVIADFHTYFYTSGFISNMISGDFEGISNHYGTGDHVIPMNDVLCSNVFAAGNKHTIRTICQFVFDSYQNDMKEFQKYL